MPKLARYKCPDYGISDIIEDLKKIKKFVGDTESEISREAIGTAIGMSRGGAFSGKMSSLSQYGFTTASSSGKVKLTELAKDIMFPIEGSDQRAITEAVRNIKLFEELYTNYKDSVTEDKISWFLAEKAGVERSKIEKTVKTVQKIYMEAVPYFKTVEKPIETTVSTPQVGEAIGRSDVRMESQPIPISTGGTALVDQEYGTINIKDRISLNVAKQLLEAIEKRFEKDEEPEESD
jgi:hypothetical protein